MEKAVGSTIWFKHRSGLTAISGQAIILTTIGKTVAPFMNPYRQTLVVC
jgi:hypothetical protein